LQPVSHGEFPNRLCQGRFASGPRLVHPVVDSACSFEVSHAGADRLGTLEFVRGCHPLVLIVSLSIAIKALSDRAEKLSQSVKSPAADLAFRSRRSDTWLRCGEKGPLATVFSLRGSAFSRPAATSRRPPRRSPTAPEPPKPSWSAISVG